MWRGDKRPRRCNLKLSCVLRCDVYRLNTCLRSLLDDVARETTACLIAKPTLRRSRLFDSPAQHEEPQVLATTSPTT